MEGSPGEETHCEGLGGPEHLYSVGDPSGLQGLLVLGVREWATMTWG